jgi:hypothetical protein
MLLTMPITMVLKNPFFPLWQNCVFVRVLLMILVGLVSKITGYGAGHPWFDYQQGHVFSLRQNIQTSSGDHRAYCPVGTGASLPGVKWPKREADHSPPTGAEIRGVLLHSLYPS